jgi:serpin B
MKRFFPSLIFCLFVVIVPLGCRRSAVPVPDEPDPVDEKPVAFRAPPNAGEAPEEDYRTLVRDNTRFALDLHARLPRDGNLVTSPFAVSSVLAMLSAGARGETLNEMNKALRFSLPQRQLHPAFATLVRDLCDQPISRGYTLHFANTVWTDKSIELLPEFLTTLDRNYSVSGHPVNFTKPENACRAINNWASAQTGKQITEVIRPDEVHPDTKLLLASAISFRGQWQDRFERSRTRDGAFTLAPGKTVTVPMMRREGQMEYAQGNEAKGTFHLMKMPFRGHQMEFILLVPRSADGLPAIEKALDAKTLDKSLSEASPVQVHLTLPRFQMRSRLSLVENLKALGMKRAFDRDKADFSGVTQAALDLQLHIYRSLVQTVVAVDEAGAKAAAVAEKELGDKDKAPEPEVIEVRADHPFLFLIRHPASGTILFLGRVSNPVG